MKGIKKMAERKPYTTKTRQIILEYLKSQKAVTVSVADIEKYLKTEGIKVNTTTVYRYLDKLCAEHIVIKYPDLNSDKAVFQFAGEEKKCTEHLHLKCIRCGKVVHLDCDFMDEFKEHLYKDHGFRLHCTFSASSSSLNCALNSSRIASKASMRSCLFLLPEAAMA